MEGGRCVEIAPTWAHGSKALKRCDAQQRRAVSPPSGVTSALSSRCAMEKVHALGGRQKRRVRIMARSDEIWGDMARYGR